MEIIGQFNILTVMYWVPPGLKTGKWIKTDPNLKDPAAKDIKQKEE